MHTIGLRMFLYTVLLCAEFFSLSNAVTVLGGPVNMGIQSVPHPYKTRVSKIVIHPSKTVCSDHMYVKTAIVVCRSIGETGFNTSFPPQFGDFVATTEIEQFWDQLITCRGTEDDIMSCPRVIVDPPPPCLSQHAAVVDCSLTDNREKNLKTTLVGAGREDLGILKLHSEAYPTIVGKVCLETGSWGVNEAKVVCRSLGYDVDKDIVATPVSKNVLSMFPNSDPNLKYVIKNVKCQGTETSMSDCYHTEMCQLQVNGDFVCETTCNGQNVGVICATSNKPGSCDTLV